MRVNHTTIPGLFTLKTPVYWFVLAIRLFAFTAFYLARYSVSLLRKLAADLRFRAYCKLDPCLLMVHFTIFAIINKVGLEVVSDIDEVGEFHTILKCRKK